MTHFFGWKRQQPDQRDQAFGTPLAGVTMSSWVDLRSNGGCPPISDQGELGSCTAHAAVGSMGVLMIKEKVPLVRLSFLDLYWNERVIEGTTDYDAGATIRDSMKAAAKGTCLEPLWPYNIDTFADGPSAAAKTDAPKHKLHSYLAVQNLAALKLSLALGFPAIIGISVYESFESDAANSTGYIPMPFLTESLLGGHALCTVGYRDSTQHVIFRNSWGQGWGDNGYGYIPYAYLTNPNLASDFWTPRLY